MTTTYCTQADLESIWSLNSVLLAADDDGDGSLSTAEAGYITRAIERAANMMNARLEMRYVLADLAGNTWCRDANAAIAVYLLATRRGNPPPDAVQEQHDHFQDELEEIRVGRRKVPEAAESSETIPAVSNFDVCLGCDRKIVKRE